MWESFTLLRCCYDKKYQYYKNISFKNVKGILKLVLTYFFFNSWRRLFLFNLIVKTIQKYFARPYNP